MKCFELSLAVKMRLTTMWKCHIGEDKSNFFSPKFNLGFIVILSSKLKDDCTKCRRLHISNFHNLHKLIYISTQRKFDSLTLICII